MPRAVPGQRAAGPAPLAGQLVRFRGPSRWRPAGARACGEERRSGGSGGGGPPGRLLRASGAGSAVCGGGLSRGRAPPRRPGPAAPDPPPAESRPPESRPAAPAAGRGDRDTGGARGCGRASPPGRGAVGAPGATAPRQPQAVSGKTRDDRTRPGAEHEKPRRARRAAPRWTRGTVPGEAETDATALADGRTELRSPEPWARPGGPLWGASCWPGRRRAAGDAGDADRRALRWERVGGEHDWIPTLGERGCGRAAGSPGPSRRAHARLPAWDTRVLFWVSDSRTPRPAARDPPPLPVPRRPAVTDTSFLGLWLCELPGPCLPRPSPEQPWKPSRSIGDDPESPWTPAKGRPKETLGAHFSVPPCSLLCRSAGPGPSVDAPCSRPACPQPRPSMLGRNLEPPRLRTLRARRAVAGGLRWAAAAVMQPQAWLRPRPVSRRPLSLVGVGVVWEVPPSCRPATPGMPTLP
ncbi:collagen alpha-1(I) chain-like [Mustela nigripes]|uniref:collagen alpha-1(I) chain-like n=1 Tax=Mustela nigripes TaxID=77151 RepID=UPI0028161F66|nr:collagen alpha-1(I) chain-like [Mustela nigripes]